MKHELVQLAGKLDWEWLDGEIGAPLQRQGPARDQDPLRDRASARNRSLASVVSCFFGRIVPSDAATESLFVPEGNPKNEIARFRTLRSQILAISKPPAA